MVLKVCIIIAYYIITVWIMWGFLIKVKKECNQLRAENISLRCQKQYWQSAYELKDLERELKDLEQELLRNKE